MSWRRRWRLDSFCTVAACPREEPNPGYAQGLTANMDLQQIKTFIDAMASSDLAEMEASKDGWTLRLVRRGARSPDRNTTGSSLAPSRRDPQPRASTAAIAEKAGTAVHAPLAGILYLNPSSDAPPFVVAGQAVKAGDTLCVIEAMKVFNTIRAERDGIVEHVAVSSGSEVDAGQLLMRMA